MGALQPHASCRSQLLHPAVAHLCLRVNSAQLWPWLILLFAFPASAQDAGSPATEFYGKGTTVSVIVHDQSGNPISTSAVVKVLRDGTIPAGQAQTDRGRAEVVVNQLGEFTVVVAAAGYATAEKDISIGAAGRADVDIYLRALSANPTPVPGRPVLAPKAKKAVEQALGALADNKIDEAQKHASKAMSLAPSHPDVLYVQGVVLLKKRNWSEAQQTLEKATQIDPSHANAFAALGMALCDQGKYDQAIAPLEKALQLDSNISWDARWTLARAYYQRARYDQALQMSQAALSSSHGKAPEIELLVAQSLTAVGRYEDSAQVLRDFLREHSDRPQAATARRWLSQLAANGKIRAR